MLARRGFLAGMLALGAAPAIVTSKGVRALFMPSFSSADLALSVDDFAARFIDPAANALVTQAMITEECLRILHKRDWLAVANTRYRPDPGRTIAIRKPARFSIRA